MFQKIILSRTSLRSWRDFARECFCVGSEAVSTSGEAVRGLKIHSRLRRSRIPSRTEPAREYGDSAAARPLTNPASYAGYSRTSSACHLRMLQVLLYFPTQIRSLIGRERVTCRGSKLPRANSTRLTKLPRETT